MVTNVLEFVASAVHTCSLSSPTAQNTLTDSFEKLVGTVSCPPVRRHP